MNCPLTCRPCTRRCLTTQWRTPGLSVSVVVGLHFVHFVVLLGEVQRVFIIVFNGHEAAVTTVTAHESEGEGVVVIVDLGGSYRLQNFVLTSYLNLLLPDQKIEKT